MQRVTRCPGCSTMFKVVPDQLKISQGWVRCGQCHAVFEAETHFVQAKPDAVSTDNATLNIAIYDDSTLTTGKIDEIKAIQITGLSEDAQQTMVEPPVPSTPILPPSAPETTEPVRLQESLDSAQTPEFVQAAQRAARLRNPWRRAGWVVLALLLWLVLAAQLALHERSRIAALEPQALPWLQKLCQIERFTRGQACVVGAFEHIESIVVDASGFSKLRADASTETYRLAVSLKNTSAIDLAMPAVEISLTDSQEQVLLRRVLRADDLVGAGPSSPILAGKAEFSGAASFTIDTAGLANGQGLVGKITGYRLLAFYP